MMRRIQGKSLRHVLAFLHSQFNVQRILKKIDLEKFSVYQARYKDADPPPEGYSKYLDIRTWMAAKLTYFYLLNLHKARPMQILDLGTGPGYFPYICSLYGHQAVAIDLDNVPMYNELVKFFDVKRRSVRINKFEKLPDLGKRFDLITAFMIKFNNHNRSDLWGVDEWRFFIEDLKSNQMAGNGRIFLELNGNPDGSLYSDALLNLFKDLGARVYRNHIDIGGPEAQIADKVVLPIAGRGRV